MRRLLIVLFLSSCLGCNYIKHRSFAKAIEKENCSEAEAILFDLLKKSPEEMRYNYNLITTFVCQKDLVKALKQTELLLKRYPEAEFDLLFMKGFLLGKMEDLDLALETYQKALLISPDKKIKQNMELLLQEGQSGANGKKSKGGKKGNKKSEQDKSGQAEQEEKEKNKDQNGEDQKNSGQKEGQKEVKKKLSKKKIEQIMKDIDSNEKKVRSQGIELKKEKGQGSGGKEW